jgi:oligoendopeptidase F
VSTAPPPSATAVVWDLSDLYEAIDDPAIERDHEHLLARAATFENRYKGRLSAENCSAATLRAALDEYEEIVRARLRPGAFASLMFSADTSNAARGALYQQVQAQGTAISIHLLFVPLEIGKMPEETFRALVEDPALHSYRHYLEQTRATAAHHLTEPEERIVQELSNTGSRAITRLFSEVTSRAKFQVKLGDETVEMVQSQVLALLYDSERARRVAGGEAITATLKQQAHVLTFLFNNVLQHHAITDRLRGYVYPEQSRHLDNELSPEVVANVVEVVTENHQVVADYYHLKRDLLGLEELDHCDRYAPIESETPTVTFTEARDLVLEAFGDFSPMMREMIEPFFTRNWIDAEVRPGKRGGAFCSYVTPELHPYVFLNFADRPRDVMTLAHELGHALHGVLAKDQNILNFYPSLPLAETASVFGEMLVFERLQQRLTDPRQRLAMLCGKIEDSFATAFRQIALYRFEQEAHRARREGGEQTTEQYNAIWQRVTQDTFGDSVRLGEDHAWWWLYIPHFINSPFYVYAYACGELLVLSLYARYKREGQPFIRQYFDFLAAGGSRSPEDLLAALGIDPLQKEFWQGGVDLIRDMVAQARELAKAAS